MDQTVWIVTCVVIAFGHAQRTAVRYAGNGENNKFKLIFRSKVWMRSSEIHCGNAQKAFAEYAQDATAEPALVKFLAWVDLALAHHFEPILTHCKKSV